MSLVSHKKWSIERQPPPRPRRTIELDWVEVPDIKSRVSIYKSGSPPLKGLKPDSLSLLTSRLILHCQPSNRRTSIRSHDREDHWKSYSRSEIKKLTWVRGRRRWRSNASSECFRSSITGGSNLVSIFRD